MTCAILNIDDLNNALNQIKMNMQLQLGQIKLHGQCVNFLHLVMTSQLSYESLVVRIAH